jgi:Icc-related predicted phosphoesterase
MKTVVMTHHAPSFQSISPHYAGSDLNAAYASELYNAYSDDAMPILHIHGHVHDSFDYMLGDTRVVCNPRGYLNMGPGDLNSKFNPNLVIDV